MQVGGNKKALEFFKTHPDYHDGMTIQEKYDSEFARLYKEKLTCDVEGRPFIPENVLHRISSPKPNRSRENSSQQSLSSLAANNKFNQTSSNTQKEKNEGKLTYS
jgi:hypothetical protein